jgi:hypothetical protein
MIDQMGVQSAQSRAQKTPDALEVSVSGAWSEKWAVDVRRVATTVP